MTITKACLKNYLALFEIKICKEKYIELDRDKVRKKER